MAVGREGHSVEAQRRSGPVAHFLRYVTCFFAEFFFFSFRICFQVIQSLVGFVIISRIVIYLYNNTKKKGRKV